MAATAWMEGGEDAPAQTAQCQPEFTNTERQGLHERQHLAERVVPVELPEKVALASVTRRGGHTEEPTS